MEDSYPNSSKVEIDLGAIRHNLGTVRKLLDKNIKIMAVVKADAYGHGLIPVSRTLERGGVDLLGVFELKEALELRNAGIKAKICLMAGATGQKAVECAIGIGSIPNIIDMEMAESFNYVATSQNRVVDCFLKIDTGMGRLGIFPNVLYDAIEKFKSFKGLRLIGLFSHLSSADEEDPSFTLKQIDSFAQAVNTVRQAGYDLHMNTLANTAGTLRFPSSHFDLVRIGLFLYGAHTLEGPFYHNPRPAMTLKGKVMQVRYLPPGTPVSYCGTYKTKCPLKVAVVSVGYADGIFRRISNKGYCLIRGKKAPIIGTVCMNMSICNVDKIPEVSVGDEAIFLGKQGRSKITPKLFAKWCDTIPYEILCSIGLRNERHYRE